MDTTSDTGLQPGDYGELLEQVKQQVRHARVQAARTVNTELIALYWQVGELILQRQSAQGWGSKVITRLAGDLRAEFPGMRGFSPRNLTYMRTFAHDYPDQDGPIAQQPVAQLPWGHLTVLLDKVSDPQTRGWYISQTIQHGWSRNVLTHHITNGRHTRVGTAPNNFPTTLAAGESDLVAEVIADPYDLDFLALDPGYTERQLEDALVAQLTHFIAELGAGFSFVGRQYRLPIGDQDYFLDLLFYHLGLRRFVVFELKIGPAEPEHLGKLNFYVNAVDDLLRRPEHGDHATIGILLAASRNNVVIQYALRGIDTPMAVSTYTTHQDLPDDIRPALPTPADLAGIVEEVRHDHHRHDQ